MRQERMKKDAAREKASRMWLKALIGVGLNSLRAKRIIRRRDFIHAVQRTQEEQEVDDYKAAAEKELAENAQSGDSAILRKHINALEDVRKKSQSVATSPSL